MEGDGPCDIVYFKMISWRYKERKTDLMNQPLIRTALILLVFCCVCLSSAAVSSGAAPAPPPSQATSARETAAIEIPNPNHDFGEVLEGSEITHEFKIKNRGKAVLEINQVRAG